MSFETEFHELAAQCKRHIRTGQTDAYSSCLKQMAALLDAEGRFSDVFKLLIPAFYIDLSGIGRAAYIDKAVPSLLERAMIGTGLTLDELSQLYLNLIRPDMITKHTMSVNESLYLFRLCTEQKVEQAEYILARL